MFLAYNIDLLYSIFKVCIFSIKTIFLLHIQGRLQIHINAKIYASVIDINDNPRIRRNIKKTLSVVGTGELLCFFGYLPIILKLGYRYRS